MSFYRTYRPQTIEETDNPHVKEHLLSLAAKNKNTLPHAFLFVGPRGAGKTTAARLVAKIANCEKPTKTGPCGSCSQCSSIAKGTNLDVLEIDAASNRGIDEIRQLRERIGLAPVAASFTVYIIDEVHMLTAEAFNALLKTLEEPPAHAIFVLATTEQAKVPATVQSRCMLISFTKAKEQDVVQALLRIVRAEDITIDPDALTLIALKTDGSFRDAVKSLEQASLSGKKITLADIEKLFAGVSSETLREFLSAVLTKDRQKAFTLIETWVTRGIDIKQCMFDAISVLEKELLLTAKGGKSPWEYQDIMLLVTQLIKNTELLKLSPLPQLPLELTVAEFCLRDQQQPLVSTKQPKHEPGTNDHAPLVSHADTAVGTLSIERLVDHWKDVIATVGKTNHSVAGVLRSTRPKTVEGAIVTIEAFYSFHKDKLSEPAAKEVMAAAVKTLFGEKVTVQIDLGKK